MSNETNAPEPVPVWFCDHSTCENRRAPSVDVEALAPVLDELKRAEAKFPTWPTDALHALAVLGEEYGELTKAVLQHTYEPQKSSRADVRAEAIQTAAMALRFVRSLNAYTYRPCEQHEQAAILAAAKEGE